MDTSALDSLTRLGRRTDAGLSARDAARLDDQQLFASVLQRARQDSAMSKQASDNPRAAAEGFVSIALVEPILKKLRESNQAAQPFAPGQVEKSFRGMLDRTLSQRIVQSGNWSLVTKVEESIARRAQPAPATLQPLQTDLAATSAASPTVTSLDPAASPAIVTSLASDSQRTPRVTSLQTQSTTPRVTQITPADSR